MYLFDIDLNLDMRDNTQASAESIQSQPFFAWPKDLERFWWTSPEFSNEFSIHVLTSNHPPRAMTAHGQVTKDPEPACPEPFVQKCSCNPKTTKKEMG